MADLGENIKSIVKKGLEAIGSTANSIVDVTKQKVDELNLQNQKKDIMSGLSQKVYDLWLQGEKLPEALIPDLEELVRLDEELRLNKEEKEQDEATDEASDENEEAETGAEEEKTDSPVTEAEKQENAENAEAKEEEDEDPCPLSSSIDDLFRDTDKLDEMADKVNSSLDEMGENLKKFSDSFSKELTDMANELMGKNKKDE